MEEENEQNSLNPHMQPLHRISIAQAESHDTSQYQFSTATYHNMLLNQLMIFERTTNKSIRLPLKS